MIADALNLTITADGDIVLNNSMSVTDTAITSKNGGVKVNSGTVSGYNVNINASKTFEK